MDDFYVGLDITAKIVYSQIAYFVKSVPRLFDSSRNHGEHLFILSAGNASGNSL